MTELRFPAAAGAPFSRWWVEWAPVIWYLHSWRYLWTYETYRSGSPIKIYRISSGKPLQYFQNDQLKNNCEKWGEMWQEGLLQGTNIFGHYLLWSYWGRAIKYSVVCYIRGGALRPIMFTQDSITYLFWAYLPDFPCEPKNPCKGYVFRQPRVHIKLLCSQA